MFMGLRILVGFPGLAPAWHRSGPQLALHDGSEEPGSVVRFGICLAPAWHTARPGFFLVLACSMEWVMDFRFVFSRSVMADLFVISASL